MKPILAKDLKKFIERFDNFKDGELRSIDVISPTTMSITLAGQDNAREFDWISMTFEFSGVSDARLLQNNKLSLVDMNDGINVIYEDDKFAFGIGDYDTISSTKNSTCYIVCSTLKYKEGMF